MLIVTPAKGYGLAAAVRPTRVTSAVHGVCWTSDYGTWWGYAKQLAWWVLTARGVVAGFDRWTEFWGSEEVC